MTKQLLLAFAIVGSLVGSNVTLACDQSPADGKAKPTAAQTAPNSSQMPTPVAKPAPKPAKVALSTPETQVAPPKP
jgi:hypothetical protein